MRRPFAVAALAVGLTFTGPAGAQEQDPEIRASIRPSQGPTLTVIRLFVEGLPRFEEVDILAGPAPDRLYPLSAAETDREGKVSVQLKVPDEAEIGEPFYFAVDPAGEAGPVLAQPPFQVIVRRDPAPGGA